MCPFSTEILTGIGGQTDNSNVLAVETVVYARVVTGTLEQSSLGPSAVELVQEDETFTNTILQSIRSNGNYKERGA